MDGNLRFTAGCVGPGAQLTQDGGITASGCPYSRHA